MRKRLMSILLSAVLVLTSADMTVFASEQSTEEAATVETQETEETEEEKEGAGSTEPEKESEKGTEESTESEETTDSETQKTSESETETETEKETETETTEIRNTDNPETEAVETESDSEYESETEVEETTETDSVELDAEGNIASGVIDEEYGHITWVIDKDGKLTVEGTGDFAEPSGTGWDRAPWRNSSFIKSAEINVIGMTDASGMFEQCINMTNVDLSGFETSKIVNMRNMFYRCYKLKSLDLSKFITSNVTLMDRMFQQCEDLTSLNLSVFDTSKVTNMWGMFSGCSSLTSLEIGNFDTSQVTSMRAMFDECSSLLSLDLSNFDTSQVTDMFAMFRGCNSLTNLNLSSFDTSHVTGIHNSMRSMFEDCSSLPSLDLSSFNTSQVMDMGAMFSGCSSLASLDLSSFDTSQVIDMGAMFSGCSSLTSLKLSSFNTSQVTGMSGMFGQCSKLLTLNLNNFDTGEVTNMNSMFENCSSLCELSVKSFNTFKVTSMSDMFKGCKSLTSLDLSNFNTHNVTKMEWIFFGCNNLSELNLSNFDTSKVTDMDNMFYSCSKLTEIDLSNFDVSKVTDIDDMFGWCYELKTIQTPKNISQFIKLPQNSTDTWYRSDGSTVTELPQNLSYSIALGKNYIPEEKPTEVTENTVVELNDGESAALIFDTATKMPVKDASVTIDGNTYTTNSQGIAKFESSAETEKKKITVTASGYNGVTTYQYIKNKKVIRIGLTPDTGELQIINATGSVGDKNFDFFREKFVLGYAEKMDDFVNLEEGTLKLTVECNKHNVNYTLFSSDEKIPDGKFSGTIGDADGETGGGSGGGGGSSWGDSGGSGGGGGSSWGDSFKTKKLMESSDGIFSIKIAKETVKIGNVDMEHTLITSLIDPEEKLYVLATTKEGSVVRRLSVFTTHNYLTQEKTKQKSKFKLGKKLKLTAPEDMPFLGGSTFEFGFDDDMPFEMEIDEDGKIKVAFNKPDKIKMKDFGKIYKDMEDSYKGASKQAMRAMGLEGTKSFEAMMLKLSVKVCGYGEGNITEIVNGNPEIKLGVMLEIEGKDGYKHYWVVGFVPVKIFVEVSAKGTATMEAEIDFENWVPKKLDLSGGSFGLSLSLEAGAGVGLTEYIYELEVSMTGSANYIIKPFRRYQKLWLEASGKVQRTALYFWEKTLWESAKYEHTLFEEGRDEQRNGYDLKTQDAKETGKTSGVSMISRNYLNYTDGYVSSRNIDQAVPYSLKAQAAVVVVKSAVLPTTRPAILDTDNGRYLFWVDDVASRDDYNRTALMYAKSTDGINWSEPKRLIAEADDNTIDGSFSTFVKDGNIHIIWQDGTRQITKDDSMSDILKSLSVRYAVLDTAKDALIENKCVTSEAGCYLYPCAVAAGDESYSAYVKNSLDTDDIDGKNKHSLYIVKPKNEVQEIALPRQAQVVNMTAEIFDGSASLVCEMDMDGDTSTNDDREIYVYDFQTDNLSQITDNDVADTVPVIADSGKIYWFEDAEIMRLSSIDTMPEKIWNEPQQVSRTSFAVVTDKVGKDTILWEAVDAASEDASVTIFQTSQNSDGSFGNVVRFAQTTGTIASGISASGSGENLLVAHTEGVYLEDGTALKDLCVTAREDVTDIAVEYVDFDEEKAIAGSSLILHAEITNNGNVTVDELSISVNDTVINTVTGVNLKPYESKVIDISGFSVPENLKQSTHFTMKATVQGEDNLDDNTADFLLGCPDVYVETDSRISEGRTWIDFDIGNNTAYEASGKVLLRKNSKDGDVIYSESYDGLNTENGFSYSVDVGDYEDGNVKYYVQITTDEEENKSGDNVEFVYIGYGTGITEESKSQEVQEVKSIAFDHNSISMNIGNMKMLSVTDNNGNMVDCGEVLWTSSDKRIASVDQTGLVKAHRSGNAEITAYYGELRCSCVVHTSNGIEPQFLTIWFDTQGGNTIAPVTDIEPGSTVTLPTDVTKTGYKFGGWYTQPDSGDKVDSIITVTKSITLYAHWSEEEQPKDPTTDPATEPSTEQPTEPSTEQPTEPSTEQPTEEPTDTVNQGEGLWISGLSKSGYSYTGEAIKPVIQVYDHKTLLTEKTDYTIAYKNNIKAGKAVITVTGRGNYSGKETAEFVILPTDIGGEEVHAMDFYVKISTKAQKPVPTLYHMGIKLKKDKDFTISYSNASNIYSQAGEYSVKLTGKGNYTGTRTVKLMAVEKVVNQKPVSIAKAKASGFVKSFVYTGKTCKQNCVLTIKTPEGEKSLIEGVDYIVRYTNNIKAGTAVVTYFGRNGYTGKLKKTYKILPYHILDDTQAKIKYENHFECAYAKGGSKPKPVVTFEGKAMKEGVDYTLSYKNNRDVSGSRTPCVIVSGKGCFQGKIPIYFSITPQDLSRMILSSGDKVYKPKANIYQITPKLMDLDGKQLSAGKDFDRKSIKYTYANDVVLENGISKAADSKVEQTDMIPVGTQIRITLNCGSGSNYTGTFTGTYRIVKADIKSAKVTIPKQIYTGNEITLDKTQITVRLSGITLKPEDYEIIQYANNGKKGKASVTIKGNGNYGGMKTVKFTIGAKGFLWWWRK